MGKIFSLYLGNFERNSPLNYTVPKTRQISEKIREEVPWKENFPVIRGNYDYFPIINGKFSLPGTSSSSPTKICQIFGTVYKASVLFVENQRNYHIL
jgi:hypothetical protein